MTAGEQLDDHPREYLGDPWAALMRGRHLSGDMLVDQLEGIVQKRDGSLSVKADRFWPLDQLSRVPSHDFR